MATGKPKPLPVWLTRVHQVLSVLVIAIGGIWIGGVWAADVNSDVRSLTEAVGRLDPEIMQAHKAVEEQRVAIAGIAPRVDALSERIARLEQSVQLLTAACRP